MRVEVGKYHTKAEASRLAAQLGRVLCRFVSWSKAAEFAYHELTHALDLKVCKGKMGYEINNGTIFAWNELDTEVSPEELLRSTVAPLHRGLDISEIDRTLIKNTLRRTRRNS